jgi:hypothetical protein
VKYFFFLSPKLVVFFQKQIHIFAKNNEEIKFERGEPFYRLEGRKMKFVFASKKQYLGNRQTIQKKRLLFMVFKINFLKLHLAPLQTTSF